MKFKLQITVKNERNTATITKMHADYLLQTANKTLASLCERCKKEDDLDGSKEQITNGMHVIALNF